MKGMASLGGLDAILLSRTPIVGAQEVQSRDNGEFAAREPRIRVYPISSRAA